MSEFSDYMDATIGSTPVAAKASEYTPLTELRDRLIRARRNVEAMVLDRRTDPHEVRRLAGKADGLGVAISYVVEAQRIQRPDSP